MGQTLKSLKPGNAERKAKEIEDELGKYYNKYFGDAEKEWTFAAFYRAVAEIVQEINKKLDTTQLEVPSIEKLKGAYEKHKGSRGKLSEDDFRDILQEVMIGTWVTGMGGIRDCLLFIFGVPATAVFVKNRVAPGSIPNDLFIPFVTSATVFFLAKLNKI